MKGIMSCLKAVAESRIVVKKVYEYYINTPKIGLFIIKKFYEPHLKKAHSDLV